MIQRTLDIRGGFFWIPQEGCALYVGDGSAEAILRDVYCWSTSLRPKWWQFIRRYQLLRLIETLGDGGIVLDTVPPRPVCENVLGFMGIDAQ